MNTSLGKDKPKMIKILLDSGSTGTLIDENLVKGKLKIKKDTPTTWNTAAGSFRTNGKVVVEWSLPEFHVRCRIKWECHPSRHMGYDMIIGIDVLLALGIKLDFKTRISMWDHTEIPMRPKHYMPEQAFHVQDPDSIASDMDRIKKILDAKYEATDLNQVVAEIMYLNPLEKEQLL